MSKVVLAAPAAAGVLSSQAFFPASEALAAEMELAPYDDKVHKFSLMVPSTWVRADQTLPDRRKIVIFSNPDDKETLMFIAYTPIRDDFTSLSSFGTVDQVAQETILPKATLAGVESSSEMLSAESKKQAYFFDYTTKVPTKPLTHFRSIFTLAQGATGGAGAVLVTVSIQTPEEKYSNVQSAFDTMINSYKTI